MITYLNINAIQDNSIPLTVLAPEVQTSLSKADTALQNHQSLALTVSSLSDNPSSIVLDSSAARTYQTCTISTQTSITLSGGNNNQGYEHYILFYNSGTSNCVVTPSAIMLGPTEITIPSGKHVEISYIYNGANVVITNSAELE